MRVKFGIKDRVLVSATEEGVLFSPPPSPASDFGSLGSLFPGTTSKEAQEDARSPPAQRGIKSSPYSRRSGCIAWSSALRRSWPTASGKPEGTPRCASSRASPGARSRAA